MFGRGVAEAAGDGVIAGVPVAGSEAAAFLCDRLLAAGEVAGVAVLVAAAGDSATVALVSAFLRPRCLAGDGEAAAVVALEAATAGVGEDFDL